MMIKVEAIVREEVFEKPEIYEKIFFTFYL